MKLSPIGTAALALAFAVQTLLSAPPKNQVASPTLSDEAAQAIKAVFPDATIGAAKLNIDRGLQVYYVELTGDKNADSVEVTAVPPVMVLQSFLKVDKKDLPDGVAAAATDAVTILSGKLSDGSSSPALTPSGTAPVASGSNANYSAGVEGVPKALMDESKKWEGAQFATAEKITIQTDFTPRKDYSTKTQYKLGALDKPETVYELTYTNKEGTKGVVRLDPDGKVIATMNWMKHDAAVVPDGKLVIRLNFGCPVDYTDLSGTVWKADRVYTKDNGFGALGGRPAMRLNLTVQGTDAPFLYDSERDKEGVARFDVPNGKYTVRIHFCETWDGARKPGLRVFGIKIQGQLVADKMDLSGNPDGGWLVPFVKEYKDIEVTDGKLLVEPFAENDKDQHPTVEAYEIIQQ